MARLHARRRGASRPSLVGIVGAREDPPPMRARWWIVGLVALASACTWPVVLDVGRGVDAADAGGEAMDGALDGTTKGDASDAVPETGTPDAHADAHLDAPHDVVDDFPAWDGGPATSVVTASALDPISLVVDDIDINWIGHGSVFECPASGCPGNTPNQLVFNALPTAHTLEPLAKSGATVFYLSTGGGVDDCATGGCGFTASTYEARAPDGGAADGGSDGGGAPWAYASLAADGSNVYFTDGARSHLYQCASAAACSAPLTLVSAAASATIGPLAVSATEVYYALAGSGGAGVFAVPIGGGAPRTVCSLTGAKKSWVPSSLAFGGSYVYLTYSPSLDTSIYTCHAGGSGAPGVFIKDVAPTGLSADGTRVYWANDQKSGNVVVCPVGLACGAPAAVATGQANPSATAVNSTRVFWITPNGIFSALK